MSAKVHMHSTNFILYQTHCWSRIVDNTDQNHKAGQMGGIAADMSVIDDTGLHPTVGPCSSRIGSSFEIEKGATE